jgi:hypothetical protein
MSQFLTDMKNASTTTVLQIAGNANTNGVVLDLQPYKGPVTFILAVGQITSGLGTAHLNVANIQTSATNVDTAFADVTGGAFTAVVNAANASNCGVQLKTFDTRALSRYVRVPIQVSGTNANVPVILTAVTQLERV